jgi:hypothetical protein
VATIGRAIWKPISAFGEKAVDTVAPVKTEPSKPSEMAGNGDLATIRQPDSPGQQSQQNYDYQKDDEIIFSQPTTINEVVKTETGGTLTRTINVPAGSKKLTKETQKVGQVLGAAQKDMARSDAAWLASFQWVQGVGVLVLLLGVVGFAHPAIRILIGGKDVAMVVGLSGLVLIFGPALLQRYGNYFALALIGTAVYWAIARFKYQHGQLDAIKEKDANNGT